MVAAFGFAASMDHFGHTPRLYGMNFTFGAGQPFIGDAFQKHAIPVIEAEPGLQDLAVGNFQQFVAVQHPAGKEVQEIAWALTNVKGTTVTPDDARGSLAQNGPTRSRSVRRASARSVCRWATRSPSSSATAGAI